MSLVLAVVLASAVGSTDAAPAEPAAKVATAEPAKSADCDTKDKTVEALTTETKTAEKKSAEEKALANLGFKSDQPKKTGPVISGATPPMETCK